MSISEKLKCEKLDKIRKRVRGINESRSVAVCGSLVVNGVILNSFNWVEIRKGETVICRTIGKDSRSPFGYHDVVELRLDRR